MLLSQTLMYSVYSIFLTQGDRVILDVSQVLWCPALNFNNLSFSAFLNQGATVCWIRHPLTKDLKAFKEKY